MKTTIMTSEEWSKKKSFAEEYEQRFVNVQLNEIELTKNTFGDNIVDIKGKPMSVSKAFVNQFMSECGLGGFVKSVNSIKNEEISARILNSIRSAVKSNNDTYKIIVSPENEIVELSKNNVARLSNKTVFDLSEHIANKYNLDIIHAETSTNGNSTIKLISNKQISVTNENDEIHKFGLSLSSNFGQTTLENFALRLVCTNGMQTIDDYSKFSLGGITPNELTSLFNHILRMRNENFVPKEFVSLVKKAKETTASILETETTIKSIVSRVGGFGDVDEEQSKMLENKFLSAFFPEYMNRKLELLGKGVSLEELSKEDKKFVHCGNTSVWDLVNILTNFGSNNLGMKINSPMSLQVAGGKMLSSEHDLEKRRITLLKL